MSQISLFKRKKWGIPDFPPILSTKCQKEVQPYLRACIQPVYAVYFVRIPSFLGTEWVRIQIVYVCNDSLDKTGITNNRIRLTIFHQNRKPIKSQVNLPVGTVPFYKEPFCTKVSVAMRYQGCGNNFVIQVKKKNPELNTTGNNDAADTITYSTPIRKVKKSHPLYVHVYPVVIAKRKESEWMREGSK